jgi:hypothetical protein
MSVEAELAKINVTLDGIRGDVSSLKKTVNGNGSVGMVGRVAALETAALKHSRQVGAVGDMRRATRVALIALSGTVITGIVSLLVALL